MSEILYGNKVMESVISEKEWQEELICLKKLKAYYDARRQARSVKVGRNEPCPCGSGKKYKKCCSKLLYLHIKINGRRDKNEPNRSSGVK